LKSVSLSEYFTLNSGAIITCPNPKCPSPIIARLKNDLAPGQQIVSDNFDDSLGQGLTYGQRPRCKACGHYWLIDTHKLSRIHTARGWFPPERQLVEGLRHAKSKA